MFHDTARKPHPVLKAIAEGRIEWLGQLTKSPEQGGQGFSIHQTDAFGHCPVMTAVIFNQPNILHKLIQPTKKGGYGLSLKVADRNGNTPVLLAACHGRIELLHILVTPKKKGGFGLSIKRKNIFSNCVVLAAIGCGQTEMLSMLIKPKADGGFGRSINVKNNYGYGPIEIAVINNQINTFKLLIDTKNGYSLPVNNIDHLLRLASNHCNKDIFLELFTFGTVSKLNMSIYAAIVWGISIQKQFQQYENDTKLITLSIYNKRIETALNQPVFMSFQFYAIHLLLCKLDQSENVEINHEKLFMAEFNRKFYDVNCIYAVDWAMKSLDDYNLFCKNLKSVLCERFKKILLNEFKKNELGRNEYTTISCLVDALENLKTGEGRMLLAENYVNRSCYVEAFEHYLSVYTDLHCSIEKADTAGFEIANLIFNGYVILSPNGTLDEAQSRNRFDHTIAGLDVILKHEGINLKFMQKRVIHAYEYLYGVTGEAAVSLMKRFHNILAGHLQLGGCQNNPLWTMKTILAFNEYYKNKNSMLLNKVLKKHYQLLTSRSNIFASQSGPGDTSTEASSVEPKLSMN